LGCGNGFLLGKWLFGGDGCAKAPKWDDFGVVFVMFFDFCGAFWDFWGTFGGTTVLFGAWVRHGAGEG
jgi:hypothetical protein